MVRSRSIAAVVAITVFVAVLTACSSDDKKTVTGASGSSAATPTTAGSTVLGATQYVENAAAIVEAADFDAAEKVKVELGEMFFKPAALTFEAGKPYILEMVNTGAEKHEFAAEDFARSVAFRKIENGDSEVKMPFFREVEVFAGKSVELFFVAVMPGTYDMFCEIEGHREKGMEGSITVTGVPPTAPSPVLADLAAGPWVQNGPALVEAANFDAMETIRVELGEMFFKPKDIALTANKPYKLELVNTGTEKHEFVATDFFNTIAFRKAEDSIGEYKGPTLSEVEVFPGKQTDLYVIPTKAGSYLLVCEIEGHREKGMEGTFTVAAG